MVPSKYGLAAIGRHLVSLFEVRRPAVGRFDGEALGLFRREAEEALERMEQQSRELGFEDPKHWKRARDVVETVLLPRYLKLAKSENEAAAEEYGLWRGGDLVARGAFALAGLVLGALMVWIPWIPVYEKWLPWALFVLGPFLPDAYLWWYRRKHEKKLDALVTDLAREGESLDAYRPLSEVHESFGVSGEDAESRAAPRVRTR
ncbi:MAG: hypothetical protein ACJ79U_22950 [Myxococcales bacterium]